MCGYESTFRARTRGNINQLAKNRTWVFSNPEVLEKTDATTLRIEFHELTFLTFDQRLKKAAAGEALL